MANPIKLVISDFHLSRGKWLRDGRRNPLEDFHQDERFRDFLDFYSTGDYAVSPVELVINGDFFDPLAVIPLPKNNRKRIKLEYPSEVEEGAAVDKFKTILDGHPISVDSMKTFLKRGKKIIFRWGNHDAALLWPHVQTYLREVFAAPDPAQIEFQQEAYIFDRICIDHGHQYEYFNHFDESKIFIERKTKEGTKRILNLPFGSFFVLGFLNQLKLERNYITQIQPLRSYVRLMLILDPLYFFTNGFRVAWFFIKMRFITHPMRFARLRKTFMLLVEAFHRPSLEEIAEEMFTSSQSKDLNFDTIIMGHNHQAAYRIFQNGKQYVNTGTWTPITSLDMANLGHRVLRTYALIEYIDGKARTSLKIWNGRMQASDDFA